jgi:putative ABC transport system ATP-binding protein
MSAFALRFERVGKVYPGAVSCRALHDVSLDVACGTFNVIQGPSGSGKTTLLAIAGGLERPSSGRVWLSDREITSLPAWRLLELRRAELAFVFQDFKLIDILTAEENVALPLELRGVGAASAREKSRAMLERLGLGDRLSRRPRELSGGEKQRVAIARALVTEPRLILADEPTANLDWATGSEVVELLRGATRERGATAIVVSHDSRLADGADCQIGILDGALHRNGSNGQSGHNRGNRVTASEG